MYYNNSTAYLDDIYLYCCYYNMTDATNCNMTAATNCSTADARCTADTTNKTAATCNADATNN